MTLCRNDRLKHGREELSAVNQQAKLLPLPPRKIVPRKIVHGKRSNITIVAWFHLLAAHIRARLALLIEGFAGGPVIRP